MQLAKQEMLTPPRNLVLPLGSMGQWMSTVVLYCLQYDSHCASDLLYFTLYRLNCFFNAYLERCILMWSDHYVQLLIYNSSFFSLRYEILFLRVANNNIIAALIFRFLLPLLMYIVPYVLSIQKSSTFCDTCVCLLFMSSLQCCLYIVTFSVHCNFFVWIIYHLFIILNKQTMTI